MEKKKVLLAILVAASLMAAPAMVDAAYYVAGDFNGWNPSGNAMTDLGSGIWQLNLSQISVGRHEFTVTVGDWSQTWPSSGQSWLYTDVAGNIIITFNSNTIEDGWRGNRGRIGLNVDPGTWTAVGDWQGWNNANPATAMTPLGSGVYYHQQVLAPNWYQWRAVVTGTWDAIGDDFRSINANSTGFEITASKPLARFWVDAIHGIIKVEAINIIYVAQVDLCGGKIPCFDTIQAAIDSAEAFAAIYVAQETYNENVILDNPNVIMLQGGWDSSFTNRPSMTTINGSMTISDGTVVVENIVLQ